MHSNRITTLIQILQLNENKTSCDTAIGRMRCVDISCSNCLLDLRNSNTVNKSKALGTLNDYTKNKESNKDD